ncbi:MAG: exosortase E/protease, VPEID-CTERM system, partial [Silvibacterium sp.]|nr:exosortase E/protease, VPEID-CTERM system [Silvibacterium sp.]
GVGAGILRHPFQLLWTSSSFAPGVALQTATFHAAQSVLRYLLPDLISEPAKFILGTPRFLVFIAPECSGMEGIGLILLFTAVWLWYFRNESRFPHAFLLIPCALLGVWLLNVVRIAAIVLIGNAGQPDIAMVGFHSQAGWIAFTAVALGFSMAARKISWVRREPDHTVPADPTTGVAEKGESAATSAYLVPFLAILAASFVSRAASGSFEWFYPLRLVAGAIAVAYFRKEYRLFDWRSGWQAPVAGAFVFLVWIGPSLWWRGAAVNPLTELSPAMRIAWLAVHLVASITVVPLAEELAFRGYLARRVLSRDFDLVSYSNLTPLAIGISSLAFGLLQGQHWFQGIVAGIVYAVLVKQRGRLGEAIIAHATTNLLVSAWVLVRGDWWLW